MNKGKKRRVDGFLQNDKAGGKTGASLRPAGYARSTRGRTEVVNYSHAWKRNLFVTKFEVTHVVKVDSYGVVSKVIGH